MATHSSILAWRIPWTGEPGGLQSMESQRVRHDRSDLTCMHVCIFSVHLFVWLCCVLVEACKIFSCGM